MSWGYCTIDEAPAILATSHLLAVHDDVLLGADDSERNDALYISQQMHRALRGGN